MSGDSVGRLLFDMRDAAGDGDSPEFDVGKTITAWADRLESLDRQHREEVARHEAFASQAVLDMRRKDGLIEAASHGTNC